MENNPTLRNNEFRSPSTFGFSPLSEQKQLQAHCFTLHMPHTIALDSAQIYIQQPDTTKLKLINFSKSQINLTLRLTVPLVI